MLKFCNSTMAALLLLTTTSLCSHPLMTVESLSENVGLLSHSGAQKPYSAMSVIHNLTDLYKNNTYKGDELDMFNQQVAHYICFGKFKKNTNEFIPDTTDNLVNDTSATVPQVKDIFNLFLWGGMRDADVSDKSSLATYIAENLNKNVDAHIKGHLGGAVALSEFANHIITAYQHNYSLDYEMVERFQSIETVNRLKTKFEFYAIDPFSLGKKVCEERDVDDNKLIDLAAQFSTTTTTTQATTASQTEEHDIPAMQPPVELTKEEKKQNFLSVFGNGVNDCNKILLTDQGYADAAFDILGMEVPTVTLKNLNSIRAEIVSKRGDLKLKLREKQQEELDRANEFLAKYLEARGEQLTLVKTQTEERKKRAFLKATENLNENNPIEEKLFVSDAIDGALLLLGIDPQTIYRTGLWVEIKKQKECLMASAGADVENVKKAFTFLQKYLENQVKKVLKIIQYSDLNTIEGQNLYFENLNIMKRMTGDLKNCVLGKLSVERLSKSFFIALKYIKDGGIMWDAPDVYVKDDIRTSDWIELTNRVPSNISKIDRSVSNAETEEQQNRLSGAIEFIRYYTSKLSFFKIQAEKLLVEKIEKEKPATNPLDESDDQNADVFEKTDASVAQREKYKALYNAHVEALNVAKKDLEEEKKTLRVAPQKVS